MDHKSIALLLACCATGCEDKEPALGSFDGPEYATTLSPEDGGPFESTVGFVTNSRRATIVPLDLKHATLLGDQFGAPYLRPRWIATGDTRQLGPIAAWAASASEVTLFTADLANDLMIEAPYVVGTESGEPQIHPTELVGPTFIDADESGSFSSLSEVSTNVGFTTTENWTIEYDGEKWWVTGSQSGKQTRRAYFDQAYVTDNRELEFTITGDATEGDRIEVTTDTGIEEHDLGGTILDLIRIPEQDLLVAAVWDPLEEQGFLSVWDMVGQQVLEEIDLREGAQPWRFALGEEGTQLFVGDAVLSAVHMVELDVDVPSASVVVELETQGPVVALAWLGDPGDEDLEIDPFSSLLVAPSLANRVDLYDLRNEEWVDINPFDDVVGGIDLRSPVVGLSSTVEPIRLQQETKWGARIQKPVAMVTLFDGSIMMIEGDTGCMAITAEGPHVPLSSTDEAIDFYDEGASSDPYLYEDEATGRRVAVHACGGISQEDSWTITYDGMQGDWEVEATVGGIQEGRVQEDQRYVSDDGSVSFLILAGAQPSTDGDSFSFSIDEGLLRIDEVVLPRGVGTDPLEMPAAPVSFVYEAGPSGGGWDEDHTRSFALVPVTNSDFVLRIHMQAWKIDVVWD